MSERGLGFAVLNDSKYGWMARGSQLTLSLLKAPKSPDDTCDMGSHQFKYALMPHAGTLQEAEVVRRGYEFNNPLRLGRDAGDPDASPSWSGLQVAGEGAVLHTVKPCEDGSGDLLLRLFESNGAQTTATVSVAWPVASAVRSDGTEAVGDALEVVSGPDGASVTLDMRPFSIHALRLSLEAPASSGREIA